ncbi:PEP-CTERM sorting domain-containing protein [Pseudocolwellia agarivorans]|uniref:PEP-CTERM sorting domain-containing protein n=1 Tax=Pseudocolwellia agarivorans TaxID=1911682 RepID=UPI00158BC96D|nr:PEP-CTERM sorting domain-containing protein [Pseudocolwellia agarivorans]
MKQHFVYKDTLKAACLVVGIALSGSASAGLINNNFQTELSGWSADYHYYDIANDTEHFFEPVTDFGNFTNNFVTGVNSVTLNTSTDGINDYFGFYLFQKFVVDQSSFELSLDFDASADFATVTLIDDNDDVLHDFMTGGSSVDISSFANSTVSLQFGIEDFDFIYDDYLTISNISISEKSLSVPEPSTFAIFALSLLAFGRRLQTRK